MKKFIALLLLLSMLITLVACKPSDDNPDTQQLPAESTDNGIFEPDAELVSALGDYIENLRWIVEPAPLPLFKKIDRIKSGLFNAYCLVIDAENFYFVCAYYSDKDEYLSYSNVADYIWVGFEGATNIPERYNDLYLVKAFQVNDAFVCKDIIAEEDIQPSAHFCLLPTKFEQGYNVTPAKTVSQSVVYLSTNESSALYVCSDDAKYSVSLTEPCVKVNGNYYVGVLVSKEYSDGSSYEANLEYSFGDYYDQLMSVMIVGQYNKPDSNGTIMRYGLISFADFAQIVNGGESNEGV